MRQPSADMVATLKTNLPMRGYICRTSRRRDADHIAKPRATTNDLGAFPNPAEGRRRSWRRAAVDLFPNDKATVFDPFMADLGYDANNITQDPRTPAGIGNVRFLLVEAAQAAARCNPDWRRRYMHLAMRRHKSIAKVAMGRRLGVRLYWMWRNRCEYSPSMEFGSYAGQLGTGHGV
jgi:hypothetical protein